jgi:hypothetical protein
MLVLQVESCLVRANSTGPRIPVGHRILTSRFLVQIPFIDKAIKEAAAILERIDLRVGPEC